MQPEQVLERQAERSPPFKQWFEKQCHDSKLKHLGLQAFLAKPFQRLCRYPLYLRRLMELYDKQNNQKDVELVKLALGKLKVAIDSVNKYLHNLEVSKEVVAVNKALQDTSNQAVGGSSKTVTTAQVVRSPLRGVHSISSLSIL